MKSVSNATLLDFKGFFKIWMYKQQELTSIQMFIDFANQYLAVLCVTFRAFFDVVVVYTEGCDRIRTIW